MPGLLIAVGLTGLLVGAVHAGLVARQGVTLRPLTIVVLGVAATAVLWALLSGLSPDETRAWGALLAGFALGNGIVSLSPRPRRRPAHH